MPMSKVAMSNKLAIISACSLLGSLVAFNVEACPVSTAPDGRCFAPLACTNGYYLGPYGQCFPYWRP
jgi:hypothetical protein